ncbi:MAG: tRNA pseudouridine(55) synthase TruB [Clostridia bacterium]|nr:tRNA pseudouridine(55) synthase TruB [Clostridia bacterium]
MCGLLLLNKPSGITSFAAVAKVRRLTGEKHTGHTGTLDPMASGVLPVLIGRATKLSDYLLCTDKSYTAKIKLGVLTDTLDITGNVTEEKPVSVTNKEIDSVLESFTGEISQIPPMFSAIKKDGVRLYRLARKGESIELAPRKITVFSLSRTSDIDENFEFDISCTVSKGTYIRALCRDIGSALGVPATLTSLCRTKTAGFDIEECVSLDELNEDNISGFILPASRAAKRFRPVNVTRPQAVRFSNGGALNLDRLPKQEFLSGEIVRVCLKDSFLGLATANLDTHQLTFKCIINEVKGE